MNRFRFLLVALCTLALASVASAAIPTDTSSSAGVCTKLCAIGFHCVPTPNGGTCVPGNGLAEPAPADSTETTELTANEPYCNKFCIIGYHCVANPHGGACVPGNGLAEPAPTDSTELTAIIGSHCVANATSGELIANNAPPQCGACTILCPYGTHLVQKHNCDCVCVGNGG